MRFAKFTDLINAEKISLQKNEERAIHQQNILLTEAFIKFAQLGRRSKPYFEFSTGRNWLAENIIVNTINHRQWDALSAPELLYFIT